MIRGLYSAASGMLAEQAVQDAIASNLANAGTAGFKKDIPTFKAVHQMALRRFPGGAGGNGVNVGSLSLGVEFDRTAADSSAGPLMNTRNPLDLALVGDGWFTVKTPSGDRYTRDGQFHVELAGKGADGKPAGFLADSAGRSILGVSGPISVPPTARVEVTVRGEVLADGKSVGQLKLVSLPAASLVKQGGNLVGSTAAPAPSTAVVRAEFIEQSNVNPVREMVRMITVQRAYEAAQRAVTAQDDTLGKVINEAGRV